MQSLITYSHRPGGFGTDPPAVAFSHCHITSKQDRWQCPGISWGCECLRKGRAARDGQNKTFQTQTSIYWCTASVTLILLDVIKNVSLGREGKAAWNQSHLVLIKTRLGALIHILSCEFNYFPDNKQKQITLFCLFCLQTWQNNSIQTASSAKTKKKKKMLLAVVPSVKNGCIMLNSLITGKRRSVVPFHSYFLLARSVEMQ